MSTTPRRFVLNAPSIAGDAANVTYAVLSASGATLVASTASGVVALAAGYRVALDYDLSWTAHGEFVWSYQGAQVASETFDVVDPAGGAAADWTDAEKAQIRQALGVTGAAGSSDGAGTVDVILGIVRGLSFTAPAPPPPPTPAPAAGATVYVVRGDTYAAAEGRALLFRVQTSQDLAGATITAAFVRPVGRTVLTLYCTAAAAAEGGGLYDLTAQDLGAAVTAALPMTPPVLRYEVRIALANGHVLSGPGLSGGEGLVEVR